MLVGTLVLNSGRLTKPFHATALAAPDPVAILTTDAADQTGSVQRTWHHHQGVARRHPARQSHQPQTPRSRRRKRAEVSDLGRAAMTNFPKWSEIRADIVAAAGGEEAVTEARKRHQSYIDGHRLAERRKTLGGQDETAVFGDDQ